MNGKLLISTKAVEMNQQLVDRQRVFRILIEE
jgi:hypothetical protein